MAVSDWHTKFSKNPTKNGYVYMDKTAQYEMANSGSYYFLSRPSPFLARVCYFPRWKPTSWDKRFVSRFWPSKSWKRTGQLYPVLHIDITA